MRRAIYAIVLVIIIIVLLVIILGRGGGDRTNNQSAASQASVSENPAEEDQDSVPAEEAQTQQSNTNCNGDDCGNDIADNNLDPNGWTSGANRGGIIDATPLDSITLEIADNIYNTQFLEVKPGTTVTWKNIGNNNHTVTSNPAGINQGLNSGQIRKAGEYSFTFDKPGLYEYYCVNHASKMRATVLVVQP